MRYNNILLFTIPSTLHTGHFNQYFIGNSNNLYLYIMPLSTQKPEVKLLHFQKGNQISEKTFCWYRGSNPLIRYFFFYIYYLIIVFTILPRQTIVFSTIPLFCFMNKLIDKLRAIKIVYHIGDYYPNPRGVMAIFSYLTHFYNKSLKYVVYASPVIKKIYYLDRFRSEQKDGNRNYWIFGIKKQVVIKNIKPNLLGYVGVLRPGQGLDIIFDVLKKNIGYKLEIIGDGPSLSILKEQVKTMGLMSKVKFYGLVNDEKQIKSIVSRWQIGLAPYDPSISNMTLYSEPSKVKFYLEYRLPVIMTKITYLHKEIEKYKAGLTIDFNSKSLSSAIFHIQKNYSLFLSGVDKFILKYEYKKLYDQQFMFFRNIWRTPKEVYNNKSDI